VGSNSLGPSRVYSLLKDQHPVGMFSFEQFEFVEQQETAEGASPRLIQPM
jgi:hypothetical protein